MKIEFLDQVTPIKFKPYYYYMKTCPKCDFKTQFCDDTHHHIRIRVTCPVCISYLNVEVTRITLGVTEMTTFQFLMTNSGDGNYTKQMNFYFRENRIGCHKEPEVYEDDQ